MNDAVAALGGRDIRYVEHLVVTVSTESVQHHQQQQERPLDGML